MNKYESKDKTSYILGISLVVEALLEVPQEVKKVYLSSKANKNKELEKLISLCEKHNVEIEENDLVISRLSLKDNCYGIGVFNKYSKELKTDKHLLLYGFNNEGELGTIIRSAVSFDFEDIVLIDSNIDIFDPKVVRASMGSFFHVNIKQYKTVEDYLKDYSNYNLYPFTGSKSAKDLKSCDFKAPYSILIPYEYHMIDNKYKNEYSVEHSNIDSLSLTSVSSIVLNYAYHLNLKR